MEGSVDSDEVWISQLHLIPDWMHTLDDNRMCLITLSFGSLTLWTNGSGCWRRLTTRVLNACSLSLRQTSRISKR